LWAIISNVSVKRDKNHCVTYIYYNESQNHKFVLLSGFEELEN